MNKRKHSAKFNKRRKNPPKFFNEIENLVGKNVIVRIRSELGYFSLFGELKKDAGIKKDASPLFLSYHVFHEDKKYTSYFYIELNVVNNVTKNIIDLIPTNDPVELQIKNTKFLDEKIGKDTTVIINRDFNYSKEIYTPCWVKGKLKVNNKEKLFYIKNYDSSIFLSFKLNAVYYWTNLALYVNI